MCNVSAELASKIVRPHLSNRLLHFWEQVQQKALQHAVANLQNHGGRLQYVVQVLHCFGIPIFAQQRNQGSRCRLKHNCSYFGWCIQFFRRHFLNVIQEVVRGEPCTESRFTDMTNRNRNDVRTRTFTDRNIKSGPAVKLA